MHKCILGSFIVLLGFLASISVFAMGKKSTYTWSDPRALSGRSINLEVLNGRETLYSVWAEQDYLRFFDIRINQFIPRLGWQVAKSLTAQEMRNCLEPKVALDTSGQYGIIACERTLGSQSAIFVSHYLKEKGWGPLEQVSELTSTEGFSKTKQDLLKVAVGSDGTAFVVWLDRILNESRGFVKARVFHPTTGWSAIERLDAKEATPAFSFEPQLAVSPFGLAMVVWIQKEKHNHAVWYRTYQNDQWSKAQLLEKPHWPHSSSPRLVFDQAGNGLVVWTKHNSIFYRKYFHAEHSPEGWFSLPHVIETVPQSKLHTLVRSLVMNKEGQALLLFSHANGKHMHDLWAIQFYNNGDRYFWSSAFQIGSEDDVQYHSVSANLDENENAFVAWTTIDGKDSTLWITQKAAITSWDEATEFLSTDEQIIKNPQVAVDATKVLHLFWEVDQKIWTSQRSRAQ